MPETNENLKNKEVNEAKLNSLLKDSENLVADANSVSGGVVTVNYTMNKYLEGAGLSPDSLKNKGTNNVDGEYGDFVKDMKNDYENFVEGTGKEYNEFADETDDEYVGEKLYNEFNSVLDSGEFSGLNKFSEQQINNLLNYLSLPNNEDLFDDLYSKIENNTNELYKSGNVYIMEIFEKVALDKKEKNSEG